MSGKRSGVVRDANAGLSVPTCATTADKAWLRQVHTVLNRLAANTAARKETDARTLNSLYALGVAGKNAPWAADGDPAKARLASFSSLVSVPVRGPPTKGRSKKNAVLQTVDVIALTGMFYHPTNVDESDYALCQYCQLGLAGWEANDNPVFEHQKRSPDCIMFKGPAALEHLSASSKEYLRNLMAAEAAPIDATELDPVPLDQPSKPAMEGMVIDTQEEDATLRNENTSLKSHIVLLPGSRHPVLNAVWRPRPRQCRLIWICRSHFQKRWPKHPFRSELGLQDLLLLNLVRKHHLQAVVQRRHDRKSRPLNPKKRWMGRSLGNRPLIRSLKPHLSCQPQL
ncbi:hypothetical protein BC830DRAFT_381669 [Chytriomyces sp. MP71]|nr:hypothetical protein BC830DRAFT_381669 [Chytriomyces sp. MP71]